MWGHSRELKSPISNKYGIIQDVLKPRLSTMVWSRGYKTFFMLNSVEHAFSPLINVKMPTIVGILTFMSGKNSILGLPEP